MSNKKINRDLVKYLDVKTLLDVLPGSLEYKGKKFILNIVKSNGLRSAYYASWVVVIFDTPEPMEFDKAIKHVATEFNKARNTVTRLGK
jgi:hypothetical protein